MVDYETFCQIRDHLVRQQLSVVQTARALRLDVRTVAKWAEAAQYHSRTPVPRSSKLDAFKGQIVLWLDAYPYSAQQIYHRLCEVGYHGGITILKGYLRRIRPRRQLRAMHNSDEKPAEKCSPGENAGTSQNERAGSRVFNTYRLLLERAIPTELVIGVGSVEGERRYLANPNQSIKEAATQPNWSREFTALGRHTLEQLSDIVLQILGWDRDHLYEFRIGDRVYAHLIFLEEVDLFVDVAESCVSCDIPIKLLGLAIEDVFSYIYDFGDNHVFRITVLEMRPTSAGEIVPALLSHRGKNIVQYPGVMRRAAALAFEKRVPAAVAPEPPRDRFRIRFISDSDRLVLQEWRASNNKKSWQKSVSILESRNLSLESIATKTERSKNNVEKWIKAFNQFGLDGLKKPHGSKGAIELRAPRKGAIAHERKAKRILEIFHAQPSSYGINRSNWSLISIVRAYEQKYNETIGRSTVGACLKKFGYAIRKARKVLTSPDPNYREKVELLLNTLQNLDHGELLFFIDELGPLRVKKYGGRALVRKGEAFTYPQEQLHRGVIMMSGALNATTNQTTWIYGRAKDTGAMIDLMELLYNQYFSARKVYVTWDAASWHKSAMLVDWLDTFNSMTKKKNEGPLIELLPLPTSSQFLDVIEAVFSGMKRAVVHHSDYRNVSDMKKAISQHFADRNVHFSENPRRAGKKIWEIDFFDDIDNIRGASYREW